MAPRKKDDKAETESKSRTDGVKASEVTRSINAKDLNGLLKAKRQAADYTAETNGALGEKIAAAVENKHLHRKAFSFTAMMDRMIIKHGPEKAAEFFDTAMHYLDISGLMDKIEKVQRLPLGDDDKGGGESAEPAEDDDTVVSIGSAARSVAEKAGVA